MFKTYYGSNILSDFFATLESKKVLLVTQQNLWDKYSDIFSKSFVPVFIDNMEEKYLEKLCSDAGEFDLTIGFGGGVAIDAAKYFSWKKEKSCYLIPSAISVDACFSYPVAIRRNGCVCYVGKCIADGIYVDYEIVRSAPKIYNLSGVGDVLSCYTGLFDWTIIAKNNKGAKIDAEIYNKAESLLTLLFDNTHEIKEVTDKAINIVMESYRWVGETSFKCGHCHYEEGSEHYFAYTVESINKLHLLHGQLVCLGIYVMSKFHEEGRQLKIGKFLKEIGLSIKLEDVGITENDFISALKKVNEYVVTNKLAYSVLNEKQVTNEFIDSVLGELK